MRPASVRTKILFLDMIATLGGDLSLDSVATADPPGRPAGTARLISPR
jgi:hypothetical protein